MGHAKHTIFSLKISPACVVEIFRLSAPLFSRLSRQSTHHASRFDTRRRIQFWQMSFSLRAPPIYLHFEREPITLALTFNDNCFFLYHIIEIKKGEKNKRKVEML